VTAFSPGFAWGAVINGAAMGTAPASDWRSWETSGRLPPSGDGIGFGATYPEDLQLLAEHGLGHVRLTFDWARWMPRAGHVDHDEVERAHRWLDAAAEAGVAVWACLHDRALPGWFVDEGSFADDKARVWWSRWVELVADALGDRVAGWVPLAEPVAWAMDAYLRGTAPPGRTSPDLLAEAVRGTVLAGRDAWRILRGGGPPVATAHAVGPVHAADATVPARQQARLADELLWGTWVAALRDGVVRVPGLAEEEVADLAGSADLIGVCYQGAIQVTDAGDFRPYPPRERVAESGWAPWSEGLGVTLRRVADELPGRAVLVVSDGVGTQDDEWRADLLRERVDVLASALADGVDCRGWFHHSAIDGYEWTSGRRIPFGAFTVDREAKPSLAAMTEAITAS
jgi:beta-glucosidase